jgi:hypothetical protein
MDEGVILGIKFQEYVIDETLYIGELMQRVVGHESASGHFEWRPVKDLSGEATTHGTGD